MADPIISASELERFCYCPLSWWLGRQADVTSQKLEQGTAKHEEMSTDLKTIVDNERKSLAWERAALWFSLVATILALLGLFIFNQNLSRQQIWLSSLPSILWIGLIIYLVNRTGWQGKEGSKKLERVFAMASVLAVFIILNILIIYEVPIVLAMVAMVLSLFWLIGTSFALYSSLRSQRESELKRKEMHLSNKIAYVGNDASTLFRSEKYGLTGRPDYILEDGEELVPVELKSGRRPKGPLFSHIVQLAAYCLILNEQGGKKVGRGLLKYGDVEFDIDFDEGLQQIVVDKLGEMRVILRTGEAHRNHNRPGKCQSCSRREMCPEKLV